MVICLFVTLAVCPWTNLTATSSVAMAKANDFDKNGIIAGRKFEEMLKILDKIEDP
jgi:hypothetical protein